MPCPQVTVLTGGLVKTWKQIVPLELQMAGDDAVRDFWGRAMGVDGPT